jgi:hypothetical protein
MPNKTLYVGVDDSNHADKVRPAEVILATFSFDHADGCIREKKIGRKKNHKESIGWLKYPQRDYRFTILTDGKFVHTCYNLPLIVPFLIRDYLKENTEVNNLEIHLDGAFLPEYKENLVREMAEFEGRISVSNFVKDKVATLGRKKKNLCKYQTRSLLIHHADALANAISHNFNVPREAENHVYIPLEQLLQKEKEYASLIQRV